MLQNNKDQIACYHEHDSLLDHKEEEALSEEDRKAAWAEYEAEKKVSKEKKSARNACMHIHRFQKQKRTQKALSPCVHRSPNHWHQSVRWVKRGPPFLCELVLDLYNPFITGTKQMTAPLSPPQWWDCQFGPLSGEWPAVQITERLSKQCQCYLL